MSLSAAEPYPVFNMLASEGTSRSCILPHGTPRVDAKSYPFGSRGKLAYRLPDTKIPLIRVLFNSMFALDLIWSCLLLAK